MSDAVPAFKSMTREQLEAEAPGLGIDNAADKEAFPKVDDLREAVMAAYAAKTSPDATDDEKGTEETPKAHVKSTKSSEPKTINASKDSPWITNDRTR